MIIRSTDQIKTLNVDAVRSALHGRSWSTISRAVRITGLSVPTVGRIIEEMVDTGEVLTCDEDVVTGGRRAKQYMLNPSFSYALCIYMDQHLFWYSLTDVAGSCAEKGERQVDDFRHAEVAEQLIGELLLSYPALKAVSVGVPAWVNNDELQEITAYPGLEHFNFRRMVAEKFEIPCRVTNDLNALVTGYYQSHMPSGNSTLAALYISSSGPGAGLIVNGKLHDGFAGFAGEIGYLPVSGGSFKNVLTSTDPAVRCRAVAEALTALVALVNPAAVLCCTYGGRMPEPEAIIAECRKLLPNGVLPQIIATQEYHRYYLAGLRSIADQLIAENR